MRVLKLIQSWVLLVWSWQLRNIKICFAQCLVEYIGLAELGIDIKDRILPIFISESELKDLAIIERDEAKNILVFSRAGDRIIDICNLQRCQIKRDLSLGRIVGQVLSDFNYACISAAHQLLLSNFLLELAHFYVDKDRSNSSVFAGAARWASCRSSRILFGNENHPVQNNLRCDDIFIVGLDNIQKVGLPVTLARSLKYIIIYANYTIWINQIQLIHLFLLFSLASWLLFAVVNQHVIIHIVFAHTLKHHGVNGVANRIGGTIKNQDLQLGAHRSDSTED